MIDEQFLRAVKILTFVGERPLTNATGFFFLHDAFPYLVTARHVVSNEGTGQWPKATGKPGAYLARRTRRLESNHRG